MNETHWLSLHFLLETWIITINIHKTPVECFEYRVAPRRRPHHYHDHFNAVFLMLIHYFCFTNATTPVSRPRPQSSCYKTANRAPSNTTSIFYRYSYAGKLVTCQQQFAQLQSRRHGGITPKQSSKPPKLKHETLHISRVFVNFSNDKPPQKRMAPLLKTFWRRFCLHILAIKGKLPKKIYGAIYAT